MAKKKKTSKTKKYAKRLFAGKKATVDKVTANVLDGLLVGGIQSYVPNDALMGFADTLVPIGVGWFRNNDTLMTIGGYQLGIKLAARFGGAQGVVTGGGAY